MHRKSQQSTGAGVRVGEFFLEAITEFRAVVSLRLGDTVVTERPVRFTPHPHGHPHDWYAGYPRTHVVTVLLVPENLGPVALVDNVSKAWALEVDADDSGTVSACDVLRYTVSFAATHALARGSVFRDLPDANVTLLTGSVLTSHGVVFRGNFSNDSEVEVRFGAIAADNPVSVSYLARVNPDIINQGLLTLRLPGTSLEYDLFTDDPATPEMGDPTVISSECDTQGDPLPKPVSGIAKVIPEIIPQNVVAGITIQSAGLGLAAGSPVLTMNGVAVKTEILPPDEDQEEAVSATLTRAQTANAGLIPFTLTPADPQLPIVTGAVAVRAAPETPQDTVTEFDMAITDRIGHSVNEALELVRAAQSQVDASPNSIRQLSEELKSDLEHLVNTGAKEIEDRGAGALEQAVAVDASKHQLDGIRNAVKQGVALHDKLVREIETRFKKFIHVRGHHHRRPRK